MRRTSRPLLLKLGGSTFDAGPGPVYSVCRRLVDLQKSMPIVVTVGGGPPLDSLKDARDLYDLPEEVYEGLAAHFISVQAHVVERIIPGSVYLSRDEISKVSQHLDQGQVVVMSHVRLGVGDPRDSDSDAHTFRIAEFLGVQDVLFVKDTPGIFEQDPAINPRAKFFPSISLVDFVSGVSRTGTDGRGQHLVEDAALEIMQVSPVLKSLTIINCRKPALIDLYVAGKPVGSTLFKGEAQHTFGQGGIAAPNPGPQADAGGTA